MALELYVVYIPFYLFEWFAINIYNTNASLQWNVECIRQTIDVTSRDRMKITFEYLRRTWNLIMWINHIVYIVWMEIVQRSAYVNDPQVGNEQRCKSIPFHVRFYKQTEIGTLRSIHYPNIVVLKTKENKHDNAAYRKLHILFVFPELYSSLAKYR